MKMGAKLRKGGGREEGLGLYRARTFGRGIVRCKKMLVSVRLGQIVLR